MAKKKSSAAAAANGNGNGNHAAPEPVTEQKRDSSPEPDRKAEQLKTLNSMLLKEAVERRGQVAALTARLEEISADGDALGAAERAVARAALAAPLRAAADEAAALRARLAALQDSLRLAESNAALEAGAKDEARARLEVAAGEKALELAESTSSRSSRTGVPRASSIYHCRCPGPSSASSRQQPEVPPAVAWLLRQCGGAARTQRGLVPCAA